MGRKVLEIKKRIYNGDISHKDAVTIKFLNKKGCRVCGGIKAASSNVIIEGPLRIEGSIIADIVFGHRSIISGGNIIAEDSIASLKFVKAIGSIHANNSIKIEGHIRTKEGSITAGKHIKAKYIAAGSWIISPEIDASIIIPGLAASKDPKKMKVNAEVIKGKVCYVKDGILTSPTTNI